MDARGEDHAFAGYAAAVRKAAVLAETCSLHLAFGDL